MVTAVPDLPIFLQGVRFVTISVKKLHFNHY